MSDTQTTQTSQTLLLRLRNLSDEGAWNEFLSRYAPCIYGWCRYHGLRQSEAADVSQEVLCKLVTAVQQFRYDRSQGRFRAWLKTVTRNALRDYIRAAARPGQGTGDTGAHQRLAEIGDERLEQELSSLIEAEAERELLHAAEEQVQLRVQPHTWQAYVCTVHQQMSASEVAQQLQLKVADVYVAKSRVISMLRKLMAEIESAPLN